MSKPSILQKASFNPKIKTYLLIYISLILAATIVGIVLLPFFLIIGPMLLRKYFERLSAELTTRALRFEKGVIFHVERTIPLDKIQDLTFKEGPLLKYFGLSILKVETAGGGAQTQADLTLIGIEGASEFRSKVLEQRDRVTDNKYDQGAPPKDDNTIAVLKEIRDSLRRIEDSVLNKGAREQN